MEGTGGYPVSKKELRGEGSYFLHSSLWFKNFILFKLEKIKNHKFLPFFVVAGGWGWGSLRGKICEKIIDENSPEMVKTIKPQLLEAQEI